MGVKPSPKRRAWILMPPLSTYKLYHYTLISTILISTPMFNAGPYPFEL